MAVVAASDHGESCDNKEFRIERLPCLVGGDLKTPVVLPVVEEAGMECVGLNAYQPWMCKALEGKFRGEHTLLMSCELSMNFCLH